jgi:hypothetical protein
MQESNGREDDGPGSTARGEDGCSEGNRAHLNPTSGVNVAVLNEVAAIFEHFSTLLDPIRHLLGPESNHHQPAGDAFQPPIAGLDILRLLDPEAVRGMIGCIVSALREQVKLPMVNC